MEIESEIEYQISIEEGEDPCVIHLFCSSSQPMGPAEFAEALLSYAQILVDQHNLNDADCSKVN